MAYIDLTKIANAKIQKLIERDPDRAALALEEAEDETRSVARFCGVVSTQIPLEDGTGDRAAGSLTSDILYVYCKYMFYHFLFGAVAKAVSAEDSYGELSEKYYDMAEKKAKNITYATIITEDNEVADSDNRTRSVVVAC